MSRGFRMAVLGLGGVAAVAAVAAATVCLTSGCSSVGYYMQSAGGHLGVLQAARPVSSWLADPDTPERLRSRLALSQRIRDFAVAELREPDNASYRRYADLKRQAAVWNVVAAPELSLEAKTWCFVVVGCVAYRGYYALADANAYASGLRTEGFDVSVYPVPAYSTLGRLPPLDVFADPLLSTFIDRPEADLARLVFHELAHQVAFAPGDTEFNESFATAVEQIGAARWLAAHGDSQTRADAARSAARRADFRALASQYRDELAGIYASAAADDAKRRAKAGTLARLRAEHAAIKATRWEGFAGYDGWIAGADNASFALLANYTGLTPAFVRLFEREGGDFARFYAEVRRLAALPKDERRLALGR